MLMTNTNIIFLLFGQAQVCQCIVTNQALQCRYYYYTSSLISVYQFILFINTYQLTFPSAKPKTMFCCSGGHIKQVTGLYQEKK